MTLIRACTLQDMAGLLALYRELRPHDPALAPDAARTALTACLRGGSIIAARPRKTSSRVSVAP